MEKGKTYTYQGFTFRSEKELEEAKKEAEVVAYIRSQADLSDIKTMVKLYNRLVEKGTLGTTIGISFLKELRSRILESGAVAESSLRSLPEPVRVNKVKDEKTISKDRRLMELYKERCKKLTIVVAALCIVIAAMFVIRLFGTASPFTDYEQKVLDEYAGWKEELTEKEETLRLWEMNLKEWEQKLTEREEALK